MGRARIRERAERLRAIPPEAVLASFGARRDPHDRARWQTPKGTLSVTPPKFMNWTLGVGGGGAIDLAMHLGDLGFLAALDWLEGCCPGACDTPAPLPAAAPAPSGLALPRPDTSRLPRVRRYLLEERRLAPQRIDALIQAGTIYADERANAVFLMRTAGGRPIGAELRGTTARTWHSLARGSHRDRGYFSVPCADASGVVLCEAAIDALSCACLHPGTLCLSTAGVRPNPRWLTALLQSGRSVLCGFDADEAGDRAAQAMRALHPAIGRLRPALEDWNDVLRARR